MSEARNIYQRLHAVMQEVSYVQKEEKRVNGQYTFVSHDAVTAKVRPAMIKHGVVYHITELSVTNNGNRTEAVFKVRFVSVDKPDDFIDVPTFGYGIDPQDKGPGKAMSYGVKYAILKTLGLETGDDPERDNIEHKPADEIPFEMVNEHRNRLDAQLKLAGDKLGKRKLLEVARGVGCSLDAPLSDEQVESILVAAREAYKNGNGGSK